MKKLLTIVSALSLITLPSAALVACNNPDQNKILVTLKKIEFIKNSFGYDDTHLIATFDRDINNMNITPSMFQVKLYKNDHKKLDKSIDVLAAEPINNKYKSVKLTLSVPLATNDFVELTVNHKAIFSKTVFPATNIPG